PVPASVEREPSAAPAPSAWHAYELIYEENGPSWRLWAAIQTPPSILPVEPLAFRHTWRLPAGVVPLSRSRYRWLPSPGANSLLEAPRCNFPLSFESPLFQRWPLADEELVQQRQQMTETASALVKSGDGTARTLGELLDCLAFDRVTEEPLVLDVHSFQNAGLLPETALPVLASRDASPWEGLGLVCVPCRKAALLTTRREAEAWQSTAVGTNRGDPIAVASLEAALSEAVARGHDSSGRFRTAENWLRDQERKTRLPGTESS